jgi:hypothetical protein
MEAWVRTPSLHNHNNARRPRSLPPSLPPSIPPSLTAAGPRPCRRPPPEWERRHRAPPPWPAPSPCPARRLLGFDVVFVLYWCVFFWGGGVQGGCWFVFFVVLFCIGIFLCMGQKGEEDGGFEGGRTLSNRSISPQRMTEQETKESACNHACQCQFSLQQDKAK